MKPFLTILFIVFTITIVKSQKSEVFKTDIDLGGGYVITTFLEYSKDENSFRLNSPKNADKRLFGGLKSTLARASGKIQKGGILVSIEGTSKNDSLIGESSIIGFGKLDFKGKIVQNQLQGALYKKDSKTFGTLSGAKTYETRIDFTTLYPKILKLTQENIYSTKELETKDWKKFTIELEKLLGKAQDDIELFFGFNLLSQELPFSHYNLIFQHKTEDEEDSGKEEPTVIFEQKTPNTVFLKIKNFSTSKKELSEIFPRIVENLTCKNLIIDLRDNGGGGIEAASEFAKYVINEDVEVGYFVTNKLNYKEFDKPLFQSLPDSQPETTDQFIEELKIGKGAKLVFKKHQNQVFTGNLFVLTNNKTASTCEPIVYVLKNLKKATIIGENTAGAMLSAAPFEIQDKYTLFLPIADFYTYDGVRLDQIGVKPSIEVASYMALEKAIELIEKQSK